MELLRALATLVEPPTVAHRAIVNAVGLPVAPSVDDHTDVMVFQAYPYASVYLARMVSQLPRTTFMSSRPTPR